MFQKQQLELTFWLILLGTQLFSCFVLSSNKLLKTIVIVWKSIYFRLAALPSFSSDFHICLSLVHCMYGCMFVFTACLILCFWSLYVWMCVCYLFTACLINCSLPVWMSDFLFTACFNVWLSACLIVCLWQRAWKLLWAFQGSSWLCSAGPDSPQSYIQGVFFHWYPPKKYGKPRLGESTLT